MTLIAPASLAVTVQPSVTVSETSPQMDLESGALNRDTLPGFAQQIQALLPKEIVSFAADNPSHPDASRTTADARHAPQSKIPASSPSSSAWISDGRSQVEVVHSGAGPTGSKPSQTGVSRAKRFGKPAPVFSRSAALSGNQRPSKTDESGNGAAPPPTVMVALTRIAPRVDPALSDFQPSPQASQATVPGALTPLNSGFSVAGESRPSLADRQTAPSLGDSGRAESGLGASELGRLQLSGVTRGETSLPGNEMIFGIPSKALPGTELENLKEKQPFTPSPLFAAEQTAERSTRAERPDARSQMEGESSFHGVAENAVTRTFASPAEAASASSPAQEAAVFQPLRDAAKGSDREAPKKAFDLSAPEAAALNEPAKSSSPSLHSGADASVASTAASDVRRMPPSRPLPHAVKSKVELAERGPASRALGADARVITDAVTAVTASTSSPGSSVSAGLRSIDRAGSFEDFSVMDGSAVHALVAGGVATGDRSLEVHLPDVGAGAMRVEAHLVGGHVSALISVDHAQALHLVGHELKAMQQFLRSEQVLVKEVSVGLGAEAQDQRQRQPSNGADQPLAQAVEDETARGSAAPQGPQQTYESSPFEEANASGAWGREERLLSIQA